MGRVSMVERTVRFNPDMYETLREVADAENVSVSMLVRIAISRFLRDYIDGVPVEVDPADVGEL